MLALLMSGFSLVFLISFDEWIFIFFVLIISQLLLFGALQRFLHFFFCLCTLIRKWK
jgi:hypothetical protein